MLKNCHILIKEKPVALFNLAAESHVDRSIDSPYPFIKNNIVGVFNLLESVKCYYKSNKKFKFIHISTDEVYGDIVKGRTKEAHPYKPSSPYAASKASSDHLVYSYYHTYYHESLNHYLRMIYMMMCMNLLMRQAYI